MTDKKKAMRKARLRKQRIRRAVGTIVLMLVVCLASIGGTLAWLVDSTEAVTNTFTPSDVDIELAETTGVNYKMVPGSTITKDPKVTVKAVSEASWLFVKIEESENFDSYMTYTVAVGWTALDGVAGVYYREVGDSDADQGFDVLADNSVTVKSTVTKADMNALTEETYPKLTFTAYAIQKEGFTTAAAAWTEASKTPTTTAE